MLLVKAGSVRFNT